LSSCLTPNVEIEKPDDTNHTQSYAELLKYWNETGSFTTMDMTQNEACKLHQDWSFIPVLLSSCLTPNVEIEKPDDTNHTQTHHKHVEAKMICIIRFFNFNIRSKA
jgi:hypothetical protein